MATNKHAIIRYHALDQCFRNPGRKYFIDDLINTCNEAIYQFTGRAEGVKRRQIFDDIKFMESEQGWCIPLERVPAGKKVYYRYTDTSFSIKNQPLNETEANQLKETITFLSRFKGMPQFEWMEEIVVRLESAFKLSNSSNEIVGFDQNRYLKGLEYFSDVFNAIVYQKVLNIKYKSFKQDHVQNLTLHPYYLKQYNNRWFLFGVHEDLALISNLALDRVEELQESKVKYKENILVDFAEYFEDMVGVTVKQGQLIEKVKIQIANKLWPYIETKPLHGSQRIITRTNDHVVVELQVVVNYELISLLFSFGDELKVEEPNRLAQELKSRALALLKNYS